MSAAGPSPRRFDLGFVVAVAWLIFAVALTAWLGPALGARGWLWLGVHHALCGVGAGHELWRARARRRAAAPPAPVPPPAP